MCDVECWLCLADLADLADGNVFFLADTDLAATLDLAFYLKEPLILGKRLAIKVLQPLNFHLAMPNYGDFFNGAQVCQWRALTT